MLDAKSTDHQKLVAFLNKAQAVNYKDAENQLDTILDGTVSTGPTTPSGLSVFDVDLAAYPRVVTPVRKRLTLA